MKVDSIFRTRIRALGHVQSALHALRHVSRAEWTVAWFLTGRRPI